MKIGVFYICIGKYNIFWDDFYASSEKKFLPNHEKTYYVFTDKPNDGRFQHPHVCTFFSENLGWPYNTLFRFKLFLEAREQAMGMDYLYFFNANAYFNETINEEIIPRGSFDMIGVLHPCYLGKHRAKYPYERSTASLTCIPQDKGSFYFQGCLFGGESQAFLKLADVCNENIQIDLSKNVIAMWHDESHLNKYFSEHTPEILLPTYAYPQDLKHDYEQRIVMRDKKQFGGHDFLRGNSRAGLLSRLWKRK